MSGTVNAVASAKILRSIRDTAKRFENSSGGGKEWRATLTEIISHLPGDRWPSSFNINRKLSDDLTGDRTFSLDDGGDIDRSRVAGLGLVGSSEFALLSSTGVYHWVVGPLGAGTSPSPDRHVIHSRQCAWFIEQLRQLGFTGDWHSQENGFGQCEMTWRTLITFLQFTLEQSNWTTELRPPHLPALTFEEKLDRCFTRISGDDRLGQNTMVPLHQLFNQEQREGLALPTLAPVQNYAPTFSHRLAEVDAVLKKEKEQLVEILGILGEQAEKDELGEGAYKGYADLLMKFHKILGEERQRIVNV
jgi:hypothetical protein